MSHELRTPLNAVIGFSEIMESELLGPLGSAQYQSYAADIHESAQHLLTLSNDIHDVAKIGAAPTALSAETVYPRDDISADEHMVPAPDHRAQPRNPTDTPET